MKIEGIDHIGIAVKDIESAGKVYQEILGMEVSPIDDLPSYGIKLSFVSLPGTKIELLQPTSESSAISKFLKDKGEGIHHICLIVDDIERSLAELKSKGMELLDEKPRVSSHGEKIAFIHPKSTGRVLIELKEKS